MLRAFRLRNDDARMTNFMLLGLLRTAANVRYRLFTLLFWLMNLAIVLTASASMPK